MFGNGETGALNTDIFNEAFESMMMVSSLATFNRLICAYTAKDEIYCTPINFSESNARMMLDFKQAQKMNINLNFQKCNKFDRRIMQNRKRENYSYCRKYSFKLIDS